MKISEFYKRVTMMYPDVYVSVSVSLERHSRKTDNYEITRCRFYMENGISLEASNFADLWAKLGAYQSGNPQNKEEIDAGEEETDDKR